MAGYWPSSFSSSHLDRTSLVNKGLFYYIAKILHQRISLLREGKKGEILSGQDRLILPALGATILAKSPWDTAHSNKVMPSP